uniref:Uncharacterized protein n=1 Tax=Physcomitrium patens TaxID=3218 RepID=A0A2K1IP42_PHYPA|nr:hypothetical protein PHYPA_027365 [Physcomitrium patens]
MQLGNDITLSIYRQRNVEISMINGQIFWLNTTLYIFDLHKNLFLAIPQPLLSSPTTRIVRLQANLHPTPNAYESFEI